MDSPLLHRRHLAAVLLKEELLSTGKERRALGRAAALCGVLLRALSSAPSALKLLPSTLLNALPSPSNVLLPAPALSQRDAGAEDAV